MKCFLIITVLMAFIFSNCGRSLDSASRKPLDSVIADHGYLPFYDPAGTNKFGIPLYLPMPSVVENVKSFKITDRKKNVEYVIDGDMLTKSQVSRDYLVPVTDITDTVVNKIDTLKLLWYSYELFYLHEPVLSSKYLGKTIYRLKKFSSFDGPCVITVVEDKDSFYVVSKQLRSPIRTPFLSLLKKGMSIKTALEDEYLFSKIKTTDHHALEKIDTLVNSDKLVRSKRWEHCDDFDGGSTLIEIHNSKGYLYLSRCSAADSFFMSLEREMLKLGNLEK